MQNLLDDLKELLQQDERLMVEGRLLKNRIIELALKLDRDLIKLLLSHPQLRQHFTLSSYYPHGTSPGRRLRAMAG